jgi:hypothetical protein
LRRPGLVSVLFQLSHESDASSAPRTYSSPRVALFLLPSAGFVIPLQFTAIITVTVLELIYSYMLQVTPMLSCLPRCLP